MDDPDTMRPKDDAERRALDKSGSVVVIFALSLAGVLGACSFALDLSQLYLTQRRAQVVSDLADIAAAATPTPIVNNTLSAQAVATAASIVTANGYDASKLVVTAEMSPAHPSVLAIRTDLVVDVALPLGLLSKTKTLRTTVDSWVELSSMGTCLRSQSGPTDIYGSAIVTGPSCIAEADTYLYSCDTSQTTLSTVWVGYSSASEQPYLCSKASIQPGGGNFHYGATVTDTIASTTPVTGMLAHLNAMANGWPYGSSSGVSPSIPTGISKSYTATTATVSQSAAIGSLSVTGSTLTFVGSGSTDPACRAPTTVSATVTLSGQNTIVLGPGCYAFGAAFNASTGTATQFQTPQGGVVLVFDGTLTVASSAKLSFGSASTYFNGGSISNASGAHLTFGTGPFQLWGGSIANTAVSSAFTIGDGPFLFYGGTISNAGAMTLGKGPFLFQGGSLGLSSGSRSTFGIGPMDFYGGSVAAGGNQLTFGSGGSAVSGASAISQAGGSFALTADSVIAQGVSFGFKGGTLSLKGIGTVNATAPTGANPTYGYRNLLFGIWGGAFSLYQSGATQDVMSGLIYAPTTNASLYGSETVTYPSGGCFGVVSGVLDIYQQAQINVAPCAGLTGNSSSAGVLVQ